MFFECKNVIFKYPGTEKIIFENLSCKFENPGFHSLFGPSGVGKTSFAKLLTGDLNQFSGEITFNGMNHCLYSYNLERLPGWSSIGRHLEKITPTSLKKRMAELVEAFGLEACMDSRFSQISMGQQNRINLIRYLLQEFDLLILDESLANVDELTREKIILKIKDMFPEAYFLYISHNVIEVSKFCQEILVFRNAHKHPQVVTVDGQDHKSDQKLDKNKLEHTMLEIMNAS